jgi:hypothetical protein
LGDISPWVAWMGSVISSHEQSGIAQQLLPPRFIIIITIIII